MKRLDGSWRPKWITCGASRHVLLTRRYAFKFPNFRWGWRPFLNGLLANLQEREFGATKWPELCPITFSIPGGWLVVMRRAEMLTDDEWATFDAKKFCEGNDDYCVPAEYKRDSFGKLDGRIVAVDFG